MPAGQPTKYKPVYCQMLIKKMGQGFSYTAFAGSIRVAVETCYGWEKVHPEFLKAKKQAFAARVAKLEHDLLETTNKAVVTSRIFALKNAGPHEWRDRHEVEHSGEVTINSMVAGLQSIQARRQAAHADSGRN